MSSRISRTETILNTLALAHGVGGDSVRLEDIDISELCFLLRFTTSFGLPWSLSTLRFSPLPLCSRYICPVMGDLFLIPSRCVVLCILLFPERGPFPVTPFSSVLFFPFNAFFLAAFGI